MKCQRLEENEHLVRKLLLKQIQQTMPKMRGSDLEMRFDHLNYTNFLKPNKIHGSKV